MASTNSTGLDGILERLWWSGEVPEEWQEANVTAVFNMGKKENPGNFQPDSLTSIPGEVMEHLLLRLSLSTWRGTRG